MKTIQGKELLKQVAYESGYFDYEVIDILNALSIVISENANQGINTSVKGLGTFKLKKGYSIKGKSNLTGNTYETTSMNSLSFIADSLMKNALNNTEDNHAAE